MLEYAGTEVTGHGGTLGGLRRVDSICVNPGVTAIAGSPATFTHPLYSLAGDFVMAWQVLTRRLV